MQVQIGASKVPKYATSESGDTLEVIERPQGGVSAVLVDGQRSGRSAKIISNIAARKAVSLLGEGVRDGAAARATHDYLRTHRRGQVSAEMVIVSADLATRTLVISRNTHCPAIVCAGGTYREIAAPSEPIGIHRRTKPAITEIDLLPNSLVVAYSDGFEAARRADNSPLDLRGLLTAVCHEQEPAQSIADWLLHEALAREDGRPRDDISILVMSVLSEPPDGGIRRLSVSIPVLPYVT